MWNILVMEYQLMIISYQSISSIRTCTCHDMQIKQMLLHVLTCICGKRLTLSKTLVSNCFLHLIDLRSWA